MKPPILVQPEDTVITDDDIRRCLMGEGMERVFASSKKRAEFIREFRYQFSVRRLTPKGFLPRPGIYYPSTLNLACIKDRFNRFMLPQTAYEPKFNKNTIQGNMWHLLVQHGLPWDAIEVVAQKRIGTSKGSIIISGRADAVLGDTVVEFKSTEWIPFKGPKFEHVLQVNHYMKCLGKPMARIVYIGPNEVKSYYVTLSDWHLNLVVARAIELDTLIRHKEVPHCQCRNRFHDTLWETYKRSK